MMSSQYGNGRPNAGGSAPSLSDLVSQSRKLTSSIERERHGAAGLGTDLPAINLALDQLESQSRSLAAGSSAAGAQAGGSGDSKAHYFLASAGIDAFTLAQNVNQANIASAFEPLEPLQDTDVAGYLQHEQQQIILSAIDEGRRETIQEFDRNFERTMHARWTQQKKRIFEELGQHQATGSQSAFTSDPRGIAGRADSDMSGQRSDRVYGSAQTGLPLSSFSMHTKLMSYDNLIRSLNQRRLSSSPYALASEFLRLAQSGASQSGATADTQSQLAECWAVLQKIVDEDASHVPRERQFSAAYFDPQVYYDTTEGRELRNKVTRGSKRFLEKQFEIHVDNIIASNPAKAQLGGQPGIASRVAAFLRVSLLSREGRWAPDLELVKKSSNSAPAPLWASIFHLLRTGHAQEALRQAEEHEECLRRTDGGFVGWFQEWIESGSSGLSRASRDRFFAEYNARFRNLAMGGGAGGDVANVDPHKIALYRLIGRVDANRKFPNALTRSTENWLWLQLAMTREPAIGFDERDEDDRERHTLEDLSRKLRSYGEKHFDPKGRRPLHYFLVLLLSGEFERAIAFLYSRPQHQADAVHFAISLSYYGLLRCPTAQEQREHPSIGGDILFSRIDGEREIASVDIARLITRHVRLFSSSDARSALEYVYLICLNVGDDAVPLDTQEDQRTRCYEIVKDLVCQTRMYTELVGDVRVDGARVPGVLEQQLPLLKMNDERDYLRQIVRSAAGQSEAEGRTKDAILLFNLAEEYDRVVAVLNRELGANLFVVTSAGAEDLSATTGARLNPQASLGATEDSTQLAKAVLETYESQSHILRRIEVNRRTTCRLLLSLKQAVHLVRRNGAGDLEKALDVIQATQLFPLDSAGDVVTISRRAESFFRDIDESVGRNLSELLLMTMDLLYKVHSTVKSSVTGSSSSSGTTGDVVPSNAGAAAGREARLNEIRQKARALMMFAGMLRFRIEQGVFAQLSRLDAFIR